jgi:hypothetical protein
LGPLLFLLYMNDLPKIINNRSKLILFADATSVLFTNSILTKYSKDIHTVFKLINKWFKGNFLSPNYEKTHFIHFITKHIPTIHMRTGYGNKLILNILHTKFPGINIDSTLSWRMHIEQPVYKLSTACYVIRSIKPYMPHTTLIVIYYSCIHSIMNYGLIFWGSSYSSKIFRMQKGVI